MSSASRARSSCACLPSGSQASTASDSKGRGEPRPLHIGVPRFELGTSPTRTERATRLRHTPESSKPSARRDYPGPPVADELAQIAEWRANVAELVTECCERWELR